MQNSIFIPNKKIGTYKHISSNPLSKSLITIIIVSLAIAPSFALGKGNMNLLLVAVLGLSPIIIILYKRLYYSDILLLLFMGSIVATPLIFHSESMRWSTVMYSYMFSLTFIAYNQLIHRNYFSVTDYMKVLKYLIYAYFIVLLIQQFCVLLGLPIFNLSNYDPITPWKLNSLSAEPSHSARIVALLMFCYITIKELIINRTYNFRRDWLEDKWVWVSFLWTMLTMGSGTAFLFLSIIFFKFLNLKNIIMLIFLTTVIVFIVQIFGIDSFVRTFKFFNSVLTLDVRTMIEADHSASVRVVPFILVSQMVDFTTVNGWFGHGIDYTGTFLSDIMPGLPEGTSGGGMFQVWLEYGFLPFFIFVAYSFFTIYRKKDYIGVVFWFLLVFMYGVNNQMVWLTLLALFTNNYFIKLRKIDEK